MHPFVMAQRTGFWLAENGFMGKVVDEWIADTQEFIRTKLPHLVVVAIIAFVLSRLLRIITARMIRITEQHAAGQSRVSQVRDARRGHSHHRGRPSLPPSSACSFWPP